MGKERHEYYRIERNKTNIRTEYQKRLDIERTR